MFSVRDWCLLLLRISGKNQFLLGLIQRNKLEASFFCFNEVSNCLHYEGIFCLNNHQWCAMVYVCQYWSSIMESGNKCFCNPLWSRKADSYGFLTFSICVCFDVFFIFSLICFITRAFREGNENEFVFIILWYNKF